MNYSNKKTIEDIDVSGKKVLLRCDFNVPFDGEGKISDTKRIDESLKTIRYLLDKGARLIIISHLGRPKGVKNPKYSLLPVVEYLKTVLKKDVRFIEKDIKSGISNEINELKDGELAVLENIRFYKEEEKNDEEFAKTLASIAEIYVNDAFGTAHRAHASTAGVAKFLPAVCGYLIKKEIEIMGSALKDPERPFTAIIGGAKVSDKIGVIENLLSKVDNLIVGGGMAYTFMNALGYCVGTSICEPDKVDLAKEIMEKAKELNVCFVIPIDNIVAQECTENAESWIMPSYSIPQGFMGLDIGPRTIELLQNLIKLSKTIVWNGPLGVFEINKFRKGTLKVAQAIAESESISIIGGGDSAAAIELMGLSDKITHVSTGGGASLEFLEGKDLPGISALDDK